MTEEKPKDSPPVDSPMPDPAQASTPVDSAAPAEPEHGLYDEIDDESDKPDFDAEQTEENA